MPIYEYECDGCLSRHEYIQKFTDPPKIRCPKCGGNLHKLISMNTFHLKGGGWYADGYSSAIPEESKKRGEGADIKKKNMNPSPEKTGPAPSPAS